MPKASVQRANRSPAEKREDRSTAKKHKLHARPSPIDKMVFRPTRALIRVDTEAVFDTFYQIGAVSQPYSAAFTRSVAEDDDYSFDPYFVGSQIVALVEKEVSLQRGRRRGTNGFDAGYYVTADGKAAESRLIKLPYNVGCISSFVLLAIKVMESNPHLSSTYTKSV